MGQVVNFEYKTKVLCLQNQFIDATSLMSRIMQRTGNPSIDTSLPQ